MFPIWGDNLFCAFLQGLTPPLHPAPGTTRSDETLVRECQAIFRRNVRFVLPHIKAGGTPGGVSPCKKTQNKLSPHIGNRAIKKDNGVNNCDCTMSRADVDADTAVHPVQKAGDVTFNQVLWHRQCAYSICGRASEVRPDIPSA